MIVSGNVVVDSFMGMKAMHGSRNVIISGNQFVRNSLWSIGLMPGVAAHAAEDGKPDNADGGSIVADNLIHQIGPPRYSRAVVIHPGANGPRGMHFSNNLFPPGSQGVCNQDLPP